MAIPCATVYHIAGSRRLADGAGRYVAQGGLEPNESLASGALRELYEECGPNLDVWSVGKVPAAHFAYKGVPKAHEGKGLEGTKVRRLIHTLS